MPGAFAQADVWTRAEDASAGGVPVGRTFTNPSDVILRMWLDDKLTPASERGVNVLQNPPGLLGRESIELAEEEEGSPEISAITAVSDVRLKVLGRSILRPGIADRGGRKVDSRGTSS